jgi:hypothetical protein
MDIVPKTFYSPIRMSDQHQHMRIVGTTVMVALMLQPLVAQNAMPEDTEKYEIKIIRGANLVNSVKRRVATEPIVEVHDRNKKPIGGVILTFTLPQNGAGGTFTSSGSNIATVTTGANGQATMPPFQSNAQSGSYNITVSGSANGQTFSTVIPVSNAAVTFAHSTALKITIFAAVAAGVATGLAVSQSGSSNNKTSITPGTPTVSPAGIGK